MEYKYELKIPMERIAVLIGSKGSIKKELEQLSNSKISIDSSDGTVTIVGSDAIVLYALKNVIYAVGRGFNPKYAELLFKSDYSLETIKLGHNEFNKKALIRIRSRVIGTKGKCRKYIENLTDVHISIYGKTITIIGEARRVDIAKNAITMLINGSEHSSVYAWLESTMKNIRLNDNYRLI